MRKVEVAVQHLHGDPYPVQSIVGRRSVPALAQGGRKRPFMSRKRSRAGPVTRSSGANTPSSHRLAIEIDESGGQALFLFSRPQHEKRPIHLAAPSTPPGFALEQGPKVLR